MQIGFVGVGAMGRPVALAMCAAGLELVVWDRISENTNALRQAGAAVVEAGGDVFLRSNTVFMMLPTEEEIDLLLGRGETFFSALVRGRTVVNMATMEPEYSQSLEADILGSGGSYVEAPVLGTLGAAGSARPMVLVAGKESTIESVSPLLAPVGAQQFTCGPVPSALRMKLAANMFLATMTAAMAEAFHFAQEHGLDLKQFKELLDAGTATERFPAALIEDASSGSLVQPLAVDHVLKETVLAARAAVAARLATPMLDRAYDLYWSASKLGHGNQDPSAVLFAIVEQTRMVRTV